MRYYATDTIVKTTDSEKLKNDVDAWLKIKGNTINKCKNTLLAPRFNSSHSDDVDPLAAKNKRANDKFMQRVAEQKPVLVNYFEKMNTREAWKILLSRCTEKTSSTHLRKAMKGETSFVNRKVWDAIVVAVNQILSELTDEHNIENTKKAS